jgi:DNA invertase Pin-like site-specific DNA recombinase
MGRNMRDILQTVKELTDQGVTPLSVTDGIDSGRAHDDRRNGVPD